MVPKVGRILLLNILRGATHNTPTIHLSKTAPAPADADVVLDDFDEADFDGYAPQTPVWGVPALDGSFVAYSETLVVDFIAGALIVAPQTIHAVYVTWPDPTAAGADALLYFERLVPTVTLVNPGEKVSRVCKMGDTDF